MHFEIGRSYGPELSVTGFQTTGDFRPLGPIIIITYCFQSAYNVFLYCLTCRFRGAMSDIKRNLGGYRQDEVFKTGVFMIILTEVEHDQTTTNQSMTFQRAQFNTKMPPCNTSCVTASCCDEKLS